MGKTRGFWLEMVCADSHRHQQLRGTVDAAERCDDPLPAGAGAGLTHLLLRTADCGLRTTHYALKNRHTGGGALLFRIPHVEVPQRAREYR